LVYIIRLYYNARGKKTKFTTNFIVIKNQQHRQCTYKSHIRRVRVTTVTV